MFRSSFRHALGASVLIFLLLAIPSTTTATATPTFTIKIDDRPLRDALQQVSRETGMRYRVESSVPNVRLSLNLRDVSVEAFLGLMLRQASVGLKDRGLTWKLEREIYIIQLGPPVQTPEPEPGGAPIFGPDPLDHPNLTAKYTLALKDEPLERAVRRIFSGTGVEYRVQRELKTIPITLSVRDLGALAFARVLIRRAATTQPRAALWLDKGVYVFGIAPSDGKLPGQP